MAEKKKYNSILISGRKDQTLTYSKYVKDEESGESVKESLDKKVNATDELTTQQIKDGAITNEKMAAGSVGNTNLQDGSVSNEKLEDGSITNDKLAENSITKDKLKDNTIGVEKLDPELRQTINAATGLPNDLVETIQNVDDTLKDHQRQLDDKQSQIEDKQQQITANDEDISLLQTRSTQMEETIKSIAATGGASQATAVTYNNEKSKLTAVNIQSAVDEVVDKVAIKDEEGALVETPFRYIQNEEFIFAKVDAEDKLLFGIQWDGTPVFGKTSAVEDKLQSQVTLLAERVATIMGDEDTTNVIDTMNELKKFFAEIENTETLTSILANLNSLNTKFGEDIKNLQDTKVDKEEGKSLIDTDVADAHSTLEDPEKRMEIITDADEKILSYRDSDGIKHEEFMYINHLRLSAESVEELNNAFNSAGIKLDSPANYSKDSLIELPIPRITAQVILYAPKLPTTKQDDIEAEIEYNDKDGNYFRKPVILNAQGNSSMQYDVKNLAIDLNDESKIKFGDFPTQDSFHLKKYYIDAFRGQCIVGYWLMEQVYKSHSIGKQYPYEYMIQNTSSNEGLGSVKNDFFTGAKCHPDGFPINITYINAITGEKRDMGIYTWNLKKSKEVYFCDKKAATNIILDGIIDATSIFGGIIKWNQFEIRNPKSLIDINGKKYDGDNPTELSDTDKNSMIVKNYILRLSGVKSALMESNTKETFEKYFLVDSFIDYWLVSQVLYNFDGFRKNWIWVTYNGLQWTPTLYDVDSIFGEIYDGTYIIEHSDTDGILGSDAVLGLDTLYAEEIKKRYKELREKNIFTAESIIKLLHSWTSRVGYDNYKKEFELYKETPSYRNGYINKDWKCVGMAIYSPSVEEFNSLKEYSIGETCNYKGMTFKATGNTSGIPPVSQTYNLIPTTAGFYNSEKRVYNWLMNRIKFLDSKYYN